MSTYRPMAPRPLSQSALQLLGAVVQANPYRGSGAGLADSVDMPRHRALNALCVLMERELITVSASGIRPTQRGVRAVGRPKS